MSKRHIYLIGKVLLSSDRYKHGAVRLRKSIDDTWCTKPFRSARERVIFEKCMKPYKTSTIVLHLEKGIDDDCWYQVEGL